MRKQIVAGNWKMNCSKDEAIQLSTSLNAQVDSQNVIVFVPSLHLSAVQDSLGENIDLGAQNFYPADSGAYTGEISPSQISSYGVHWVLIGHSERRSHFKESNEFLREKVDSALGNGLKLMFCFGETLEERESGKAEETVEKQLIESLFHLSEQQIKQVVLAYEPVWAIGTGLAATPAQAQDMHEYIRSLLRAKYGEKTANAQSILYGGSVKPENAAEIFSQPDIDGGLIGGASLNPDSFAKIVQSVA